MAGMGHSVVLCDVSEEMLARAAIRAAQAGVAHAIEIRHLSIRGYATIADEKFDLVLCHAVLEWLHDPEAAVGDLAMLVKDGGQLSLMFYNRFASLLKRTLAGDFEAARSDFRTGPIRRGGEKVRRPSTTPWWFRGSDTRGWK